MSQPKAWYPYLKRSLLVTLGLLGATTSASCDGPTVQRQFRVVERWNNHWCADATHERLDGCAMSHSLNQLAGTVGVLGGGDGHAPARIDRGTATAACLAW